MDHEDNIKKELSDLDSGLSGVEKKNPFSVPEGYFDQFTDSVLEKVSNEEKIPVEDKKRGISLVELFQSIFTPRLALAAASFLLLIVAGSLWLMRSDKNAVFSFDALTDSELQNYVLALSEDFDNEDISDYIDSDAEDEMFMDVDESDLEILKDYLEEEIDDTFIEEELM